MYFDPNISSAATVSTILAAVTLIVWLIRLEARVNNAKEIVEQLKLQTAAITATMSLLKDTFHEYKLEATEKFASQVSLDRMRGEILTAINDLSRRQETLFNRMLIQVEREEGKERT